MGQVKNVLHPDKVKKAAKKVYGDYIKSPLQKSYTYFKNYTKKLGDVKTPLTYEAATPLGSIKVPKTVSEVTQDLKKATVQMAKKLDEKSGGKGAGNNGSMIKNEFPDEELPKDGKILPYLLKDGKIKGIDGRTEVDFVIDKNGNLVIGKRHHTLGNKDEVLAAGQLKINGQGEVRGITNESGHYRPTPEKAMDYP